MSFLKLWKTNSKHKKLCEECALATSLRDLGDLPESLEDSESVTFDVKYLGDTTVEVRKANANSTEAIGQAVKSVLSAAKAAKHTRVVNLTVSPKGIEIIDQTTSETLQQISIYRISNCSADIANSNIFAFISSPSLKVSPVDDGGAPMESNPALGQFPGPQSEGPLQCHVFLCQKRKVAQNIALTVAKSFERAYDIWQSISSRRQAKVEPPNRHHPDLASEEDEDDRQEDSVVNLLIDLNADDLTDIRKSYLQNTWVSFEETEFLMSNLHKNAICS